MPQDVEPVTFGKSPQGYEVENGGTCDEVVAPERLVTTQDAGAGVTRHTIVLTATGGAPR